MRKLLWTFGTDPYFENAGEGDGHRRSGITVTPANFDRVCDRFGLVCSLEHANEIFERHNLPKDGCNMCAVPAASSRSTPALISLLPSPRQGIKYPQKLVVCDEIPPIFNPVIFTSLRRIICPKTF